MSYIGKEKQREVANVEDTPLPLILTKRNLTWATLMINENRGPDVERNLPSIRPTRNMP
jgi:hypothetical protein